MYPNIRCGKMHTLLFISMLVMVNSADNETNPELRKPRYPSEISDKARACNDVSCKLLGYI